jgi:hypothetical protein
MTILVSISQQLILSSYACNSLDLMTENNADTVVTLIRSVEYNASYAYHSLYAYFDRDNVALKGFAK